jgi:benzoyl-CoA reductase/2-hydroxyglutaryl-CoA dehydratase subunit BcrC/BadD/HgdB
MTGLDTLVDGALRDPLGAARAYARGGGRVIGYVGAEIPVELILASYAFPLRLPASLQSSTAAADMYLESSFMPDVRSIAEQYLQGAFDFIDAVILPRSNDSAQRLYYYLSELRRRRRTAGPVPLIYDLAKIPRDSSRERSRAATQRLAAEIGVDTTALPGAIARRNRRRELFAAATKVRQGPASVRGSIMDRLFRAADLCGADAFDAALGGWCANPEPCGEARRILLAGSPPPDERLHRAIEAAGGNVVAEAGDHASRAVSLPLIAPDGSYTAIADHYHSLQEGTRAFVDRASSTANLAAAVNADGVVIWLIEEEDALIWDLPAQMSLLAASGIRTLSMVRRRWDGADGALEELQAFTRSLEGSI